MSAILDLHPALLVGFSGIVFILASTVISDLRRAWGEDEPLSEAERLTLYDLIRLRLALMAVIAIAAWALAGLPLAQMGLHWGSGWRFIAAWGVTGTALTLMAIQTAFALRSHEVRRETARQLNADENLNVIRPATRREISSFTWLGLTASITEEIIFRGFLTVLFALVAPLWAAIILANAFFVFIHIYQGWKGMLRIVPITVLMAFVAWLGGSLYPAITLHIGVDWIAAFMFRAVANVPPEGEPRQEKAAASA
jgi:membrane protease YdiL (CAAX protease family)